MSYIIVHIISKKKKRKISCEPISRCTRMSSVDVYDRSPIAYFTVSGFRENDLLGWYESLRRGCNVFSSVLLWIQHTGFVLLEASIWLEWVTWVIKDTAGPFGATRVSGLRSRWWKAKPTGRHWLDTGGIIRTLSQKMDTCCKTV